MMPNARAAETNPGFSRSSARQSGERTARACGRKLAERRGRLAEWLAGAMLVCKGYRIVARRLRGPFGEIDLIAVRGQRLAFVEVKQRRSAHDAAAALSARQAHRLSEAAEFWLWRNPRYRQHTIGLDAVLLGPRLWPRHVPQALHAW